MRLPRGAHFLGLVSEQSLYNLAARTVELEVLPACRAYGIGFLPWSPLGGGLLGGALEKANSGRRASERIMQNITTHRPQLRSARSSAPSWATRPPTSRSRGSSSPA